MTYNWTDNPTKANVALCDPDVLNECLMHLKYNNIVTREFMSKSLDIGVGTTNLSSYLPNDGKQYLVGVYCDVDVERRGRNQATVQTDIFPQTAILSSSGSTDDSSWATAFAWVPVGAGRTITIACTSSYNSIYTKLVGYIKI